MANKKSKAAREKHQEKRAQLREQHQPIIHKKERKVDKIPEQPASVQAPEAVRVEPKDNIREVLVQPSAAAAPAPQDAVVVEKIDKPAAKQPVAAIAAKETEKPKEKVCEPCACSVEAPKAKEPAAAKAEVKVAPPVAEATPKAVAKEVAVVAAAKPAEVKKEVKKQEQRPVIAKEPLVEPQVVAHHQAVPHAHEAALPFPWLRYVGALFVGILVLLAIDFSLDLYERFSSLELALTKPVTSEGDKKPVVPADSKELASKLAAVEANLQKLQESVGKLPQTEISAQHLNSLLEKMPFLQNYMWKLNTRVDDLMKAIPDKQTTENKLSTLEANLQKIQDNKQLVTLQSRIDGIEKSLAGADKPGTDVSSQYASILQNRLAQLEKNIESMSKPVVFDSKELENKIAAVEATLQQRLTAAENSQEKNNGTLRQDIAVVKEQLVAIAPLRKELDTMSQSVQARQQELQRRLDELQSGLTKAEQDSKGGIDNIDKKVVQAQQELTNLQKNQQMAGERVENFQGRLTSVEAIAKDIAILQKQADTLQQQVAIVQTVNKNHENTLGNLEQKTQKIDLLEKAALETKPAVAAVADVSQKIGQIEQRVQELLQGFTAQAGKIETLEKNAGKHAETVSVTPAVPGLPEDVQKKIAKMVSSNAANVKVAVGKAEYELDSTKDREAVKQISFEEENFSEVPVIYALVAGDAMWTLEEVRNITEKGCDISLKVRRGQNILPNTAYFVSLKWIAIGKAGN